MSGEEDDVPRDAGDELRRAIEKGDVAEVNRLLKLAAIPPLDIAAAPASAWLVFTDHAQMRAVPLRPGRVVLGRDPRHCDVALEDFGISRVHARIDVLPGGQMTLTDLKSKGGCQVNQVPVLEAPIAVGDRLLLGQVRFTVVGSLPAAPPAETTHRDAGRLGASDLADAAAQPGLTMERRLDWIDAICASVAAAHAKGDVHGDLHERRVRVHPDGRVEVDWSPKSGLPGPSSEQLLGGPADARSDVFALAWIAYALLTGRAPFEGNTLPSLAYRILHVDAADPRQIVPELPDALAAWLRRGLARQPELRFADAGEMRAALRRARADGIGATIQVCAQCGQTYRAKDNRDDACHYHPGRVMDFDRFRQLGMGLPGDFWSCCDGTVETTPLDVPGCARGAHVAAPPGDPGPFKRDLEEEARRDRELARERLTHWPIERGDLAERRTIEFLRGTGDPGPIQGRRWRQLLADVRILDDDRRAALLGLLDDPQYESVRRRALAVLLRTA